MNSLKMLLAEPTRSIPLYKTCNLFVSSYFQTIRSIIITKTVFHHSFILLSLQFSKACGRIKDAISNLPVATKDDDMEEAAALKDESATESQHDSLNPIPESSANEDEADPFGLDALIPNASKNEKAKVKLDAEASSKEEEDDEEDKKRFLKSQREALILCLEIAAKRYKIPWLVLCFNKVSDL